MFRPSCRFATETAEVPAQEGERVTVVCAPSKDSKLRKGSLFSSAPAQHQARRAPGPSLTTSQVRVSTSWGLNERVQSSWAVLKVHGL